MCGAAAYIYNNNNNGIHLITVFCCVCVRTCVAAPCATLLYGMHLRAACWHLSWHCVWHVWRDGELRRDMALFCVNRDVVACWRGAFALRDMARRWYGAGAGCARRTMMPRRRGARAPCVTPCACATRAPRGAQRINNNNRRIARKE